MLQDRAEQPQQPQLRWEAEDRVPDPTSQAPVEEVPTAVSNGLGTLSGKWGQGRDTERRPASSRQPKTPPHLEGSMGGQNGSGHIGAENDVTDIPEWKPDASCK